jgi:quercetin dioxygenase-like cupin family protein
MDIISKKDALYNKTEIDERWYYFFEGGKNNVFEVTITRLLPTGIWQPRHSHEYTHEATYVIKGKIEVKEEKKTRCLEDGDFVYFRIGKKHSMRNVGQNDAIAITIRSPRNKEDKIDP